MKLIQILFCSLFLSIQLYAQLPRLLITTDIGGDPDDQQSLVRLLCYSNEFEIEGLIASASGTPGELNEKVIKPHLIGEMIDAYAKVERSLKRHSPDYPEASYLRSIIKKGNPQRGWENISEGHDTEASDWIIQCADRNDPRPLNITIWGGQTDLVQALWKVKYTRTEDEYQKFISKLRVYDIQDQDRIFNNLITEHPTLFYILSRAPEGIDKREGIYRGMYLGGNESLTSLEWLQENVIEGHGPLGELFPTKTWTAPNPHGALKEGDTPSWFFFLKNSLNYPQHPEYGGWGGRYQKNDQGYFSDAVDTFQGEKNARATVYRWRDDFQREFAGRMDWCIEDYKSANHVPVVSVNGNSKKEALIISEKPGKRIQLDASGTKDPDGNQLHFEWLIYSEAGNLTKTLKLKSEGPKASLQLPELQEGESLHIILRVTDLGIPALSGYKRIIILNH